MQIKTIDTIIVGGAQAGLAMGYRLGQKGKSYLILDAHKRTGDSWRVRYDSMKLFTSRAYCQLPGKVMNGDPGGYADKNEMANYLEHYAKQFELNIRHEAKVTNVCKNGNGYLVEVADGSSYKAKVVIIASGGFSVPMTLGEDVLANLDAPQYTVDSYKNADNMPQGTVLVVGDGASGRQIALDLLPKRMVLLATGKKRNMLPQRLLGKDIFHWLDKLGILWADKKTLIAKIVRKRDPFPGKHLDLGKLKTQGVGIVGKLSHFDKDQAIFADGQKHKIDAVVWSMGYYHDTSWLDVDGALDANNSYIQEKGVSPVSGLYYIGLPWQTCRASALLAGVGKDAEYIAKQVEQYLAEVADSQLPNGGKSEVSMA